MKKLYNPTYNTKIHFVMGGKAVILACGAIVEFSEHEAEYILENYPFVIEVKDSVPKHFRSDSYDEIRKFKEGHKTGANKDEILKLSPEFYGIGINLRVLWKKIISWF